MNLQHHQQQVLRTEAPITPSVEGRLINCARLLHSLIGLQTEVGEALDAVKRHIYYGAKLDLVNLREEYGDQSWYWMLGLHACDQLDINDPTPVMPESILHTNLAKLQARYPEKFTQESATNRDLLKERKVLEKRNMQEGLLIGANVYIMIDMATDQTFMAQYLEHFPHTNMLKIGDINGIIGPYPEPVVNYDLIIVCRDHLTVDNSSNFVEFLEAHSKQVAIITNQGEHLAFFNKQHKFKVYSSWDNFIQNKFFVS